MKPLLILDIDETLIHAESFPKEFEDKIKFDFKFKENEKSLYYVIKRPYLNEFLNYVFENFEVAIWTAAGYEYAEEILKGIGIDKKNLTFFYTQENCTIKLDYESSQYYGVKNLNKLKKKGYDLDKILIVDDISKTAINNYGNLIKIKQFKDDSDDIELLKLISYLEKIKNEPNYRSIEKRGWSN
jgi:RNA polymerase II subunit A small phosphatase-like protein